MKVWMLYYSAVNVIALFLYGYDKRKARLQEWRIPEATLLGIAAMGGSGGAFFGMRLFHHKTRKWKFRILVPLCLIAHVLILLVLTGVLPLFEFLL
ncbi:MAG: DUF1294 domain-containing protein [Lachnospiraceae bacterium]|nr:DUF1294 domain-containing protein [Lachnospiraceae bacterium]